MWYVATCVFNVLTHLHAVATNGDWGKYTEGLQWHHCEKDKAMYNEIKQMKKWNIERQMQN